MHEADRAVVMASLGQIPDEAGASLALLAQVLTKGVNATLLVFQTLGYASAFERAWADPEVIEITLRMGQGGRQPIAGVESRTRFYELEKKGT